MNRQQLNTCKIASDKVKFLPLDTTLHLSESLAFREDAWLISFESLEDYSEAETATWLMSSYENKVLLFHLWYENKIIGQLEFKDDIATSDGLRAGYIFLFYIKKNWRSKGLGQIMHDFVMTKFAQAKCHGAMLKYVASNAVAEKFYLKNGWYKAGISQKKSLQIMRKDL